MNVLSINSRVHAMIFDFVRKAEARRVPHYVVRLINDGAVRLVPDDKESHIVVPVGFRCRYTVEEHPQPRGHAVWMRHLQVSLDGVPYGTVPPVVAVRLLLPLFGINVPIERCTTWTDDLGDRIALDFMAPYYSVYTVGGR